MAQVYENAYFTIAAISSPDGNVSFLHSFHSTHGDVIPFEVASPDNSTRDISAQVRQKSLAFSPSVCEGPLSSRAWAWQEKLLSKRVMLFAAVEVKWHCCEECSCECTLRPDLGKLYIESGGKSDLESYEQWHELVTDYSGRKLTFQSDRLPAISGAASIVQGIVSSEYVAGIWKKNLTSDLLWHCNPDQPLPQHTDCINTSMEL